MKLKLALASSIIASTLAFGTALACDDEAKNAKVEKKSAPVVATANVAAVNLKVTGMHCSGCSDKIKSALAKLDGIVNVDIKVADGLVAVKYDKTKLSPDKIAKTISELGFKAAAEA